MDARIVPVSTCSGSIQVPGDKSISHRSLLLSSMADGISRIYGALREGDCANTIHCLRQLGVIIRCEDDDTILVHGKGRHGFCEPDQVLYAGNSGTTMRLLMGLLAGQPFSAILDGDTSLRRRPMGRVTDPLKMMGAGLIGRHQEQFAPMAIRGGELQPLVEYALPVASAQVKSALLLAGCYTAGRHTIIEKYPTRDHTEIMMAAMGISLRREGKTIEMAGSRDLTAAIIHVPGDFSAAAFLIGAALIIPGSYLQIENVGLNPTRIGFLEAVKAMGGEIEISRIESWQGEQVGTISVFGSTLQGVKITAEQVPGMIDELPLLAVLGAYAAGETEISGAAELRLKESDRIRAISAELQKMGADIIEKDDGLRIRGGRKLRGSALDSHQDHRIAMALAIAGLRADSPSMINGAECMGISYPGFLQTLSLLTDTDFS